MKVRVAHDEHSVLAVRLMSCALESKRRCASWHQHSAFAVLMASGYEGARFP